jgi:two-component system, NtrC family, sensor kinase
MEIESRPMRLAESLTPRLVEAALLVNDAPSLASALSRFAEGTVELTGAEWAAIVVWDGERGVVRAVAGPGPEVDSVLVASEPLCHLRSGWFRATVEAPGAEDAGPIEALARLTLIAQRCEHEHARLDADLRLVENGRLATIGELASGVAHEINNPLFAILALTEFLLKEVEPGSRQEERVLLIRETGYEIKEIVRGLLDFARENPQEQHLCSVPTIVGQTVDLVRRTNAHKGVTIVESCDGSQALVLGNPNQLKQVILNLLTNARQSMPNGGTVRIDVRHSESDAIVTVSDEGPGVSQEIASRIFEPFFTTRRDQGGSGLGLAVSHGIASAHGGSLELASSGAGGSIFALCLPLAT